MKAIKLAEPWKVSCVELEKPTPKPGEALIKVIAAGICGMQTCAMDACGIAGNGSK